MSRRRIHAIRGVADVDGVEVPYILRRQRRKGGNWNVRWKMHGSLQEKSTRTDAEGEAHRVAKRIIRGEDVPASSVAVGRLSVSEFVQIQKDYHSRNARPEAGEATLKEFMGIWRSFLRVCPVKNIHDVTEQVALRYLRRLEGMSKTENRQCKKKSSEKLAVKTIQKHIRTLAGAWNRVREGHSQRVGGLYPHQMVQSNPWEALHNNVPEDPKDVADQDPVQFELVDNDLGRFLDQFNGYPVGELFIITSLWCWGRIKEMTRMEWSWIQGEYVVIPKSKAKGGRGKVVRLPPAILERLSGIRDRDSLYVFACWVEDVRANADHPKRVQPFTPDRMRGPLEKLIPTFAAKIGRPEISHHALRRTAMELGEEAELRQAERTSAEKLQTTVGNKRRNYTKKVGRKAYTLADGIYRNLTTALHDYPALANRLGCEPLETLAERDLEAEARKLTPLQRQRLAKKILDGDAAGEGVA